MSGATTQPVGHPAEDSAAAVRFWEKVYQGPECWLWTASLRDGYGQFRVGDHVLRAPRLAYEMLVGPIPEGLVVHQNCGERRCVNPDHLEVLTQGDALLRSDKTLNSQHSAKTECQNGHPLSGPNLYVIPSTGYRQCRQCHKDRRA